MYDRVDDNTMTINYTCGIFSLINHYSSFEHILSFITDKENICILYDLHNKTFNYFIAKKYHLSTLEHGISILSKRIKSLKDYTLMTNNHSELLDLVLFNEYKEKLSPFVFYKSILLISSIIFINIKDLDLQKNNIGLDGVILLQSLLKQTKCLSHLNLSFNNIGDEGCSFLSNSIRINRTLLSLSIECNSITNKGLMHLSTTIIHHPLIKDINMALNSITYDGFKEFASLINDSDKAFTNHLHCINMKYNNIIVLKDSVNIDVINNLKLFILS